MDWEGDFVNIMPKEKIILSEVLEDHGISVQSTMLEVETNLVNKCLLEEIID